MKEFTQNYENFIHDTHVEYHDQLEEEQVEITAEQLQTGLEVGDDGTVTIYATIKTGNVHENDVQEVAAVDISFSLDEFEFDSSSPRYTSLVNHCRYLGYPIPEKKEDIPEILYKSLVSNSHIEMDLDTLQKILYEDETELQKNLKNATPPENAAGCCDIQVDNEKYLHFHGDWSSQDKNMLITWSLLGYKKLDSILQILANETRDHVYEEISSSLKDIPNENLLNTLSILSADKQIKKQKEIQQRIENGLEVLESDLDLERRFEKEYSGVFMVVAKALSQGNKDILKEPHAKFITDDLGWKTHGSGSAKDMTNFNKRITEHLHKGISEFRNTTLNPDSQYIVDSFLLPYGITREHITSNTLTDTQKIAVILAQSAEISTRPKESLITMEENAIVQESKLLNMKGMYLSNFVYIVGKHGGGYHIDEEGGICSTHAKELDQKLIDATNALADAAGIDLTSKLSPEAFPVVGGFFNSDEKLLDTPKTYSHLPRVTSNTLMSQPPHTVSFSDATITSVTEDSKSVSKSDVDTDPWFTPSIPFQFFNTANRIKKNDNNIFQNRGIKDSISSSKIQKLEPKIETNLAKKNNLPKKFEVMPVVPSVNRSKVKNTTQSKVQDVSRTFPVKNEQITSHISHPQFIHESTETSLPKFEKRTSEKLVQAPKETVNQNSLVTEQKNSKKTKKLGINPSKARNESSTIKEVLPQIKYDNSAKTFSITINTISLSNVLKNEFVKAQSSSVRKKIPHDIHPQSPSSYENPSQSQNVENQFSNPPQTIRNLEGPVFTKLENLLEEKMPITTTSTSSVTSHKIDEVSNTSNLEAKSQTTSQNVEQKVKSKSEIIKESFEVTSQGKVEEANLSQSTNTSSDVKVKKLIIAEQSETKTEHIQEKETPSIQEEVLNQQRSQKTIQMSAYVSNILPSSIEQTQRKSGLTQENIFDTSRNSPIQKYKLTTRNSRSHESEVVANDPKEKSTPSGRKSTKRTTVGKKNSLHLVQNANAHTTTNSASSSQSTSANVGYLDFGNPYAIAHDIKLILNNYR